jgi:hypothetical protein
MMMMIGLDMFGLVLLEIDLLMKDVELIVRVDED